MGDQLAGLAVGVRELREQPGRPVRRGGGQRVLALPLGRRHERPRRSRARLPLADRDPGPHPQRPHQRRDIAQLAPQLPGPCVRRLRLRVETGPVERLRGQIRQHRVVVLLGPAACDVRRPQPVPGRLPRLVQRRQRVAEPPQRLHDRAVTVLLRRDVGQYGLQYRGGLRRPVQPEQPAAELMAGMGPERPALARLVRPVRGVQPLLDRLGELPGTGEDFGEPQMQPGPPARRDERRPVLQRGPCRPFRPLVLLQLGGVPVRSASASSRSARAPRAGPSGSPSFSRRAWRIVVASGLIGRPPGGSRGSVLAVRGAWPTPAGP